MDEKIVKPKYLTPSFQCHLVVKFRYFLPPLSPDTTKHIKFLVSDEDYILQFAPPFNRLELLQAQSYPNAISNHVQQL